MGERCKQCGGPFHPASGHYHAPDVPICGPCIRRFITWMKGHTHRRSSGADFYAAAATSIKPKIGNRPMAGQRPLKP